MLAVLGALWKLCWGCFVVWHRHHAGRLAVSCSKAFLGIGVVFFFNTQEMLCKTRTWVPPLKS